MIAKIVAPIVSNIKSFIVSFKAARPINCSFVAEFIYRCIFEPVISSAKYSTTSHKTPIVTAKQTAKIATNKGDNFTPFTFSFKILITEKETIAKVAPVNVCKMESQPLA